MDSLPFKDAHEQADLEDLARFVRQRGRRRREPQRVGECVSRLLARRGYAQTETARQLARRWEEAVGPELAAESRAAAIQRGVLEVAVGNSVVLQELTFQTSQLLVRLNEAQQAPPIRGLRFRIAQLD